MTHIVGTIGVIAALLASQASAHAQPRTAQDVPAGLHSHLVSCAIIPDEEKPNCRRVQAMISADFVKAMAGDYQGQRNTAYYFRDGGAALSVSGKTPFVLPNDIQSCAWRMVIVESGHAEITRVDTSNLKIACDGLAEADRAAARARAQQITREIPARRR